MSTVDAICSLGRQKRTQKRGAKSHEDLEELRLQRQVYQTSLRKNKREKILEDRRQVLQKLNWTVTWSDDEDEDEVPNVPVEQLINCLMASCLALDSAVASDTPQILTELNSLLDMVRKTLDRELKAKNAAVKTMSSCKPGNFSTLVIQDALSHLLRLVSKCAHHNIASSHNLHTCRQVTTILSQLITRYDLGLDRYPGAVPILRQSLLMVLKDDNAFDLLCFSNACSILNRISRAPFKIPPEELPLLMERVLVHLSRAATVYGPQDDVVYCYIQSITLLLSSLVRLTLKHEVHMKSEVWNGIFHLGDSLIRLNDDQVIENFLSVASAFSSTKEGVKMLLQQDNLTNFVLEVVLKDSKPNLVPSALEMIRNITYGNCDVCKTLTTPAMISRLIGLMSHEERVELSSLQTLVNMTSENPVAVQMVIESNFLSDFDYSFYNLSVKSQMKLLEMIEHVVHFSSMDHLIRIMTQTKVLSEVRILLTWTEQEFILLAMTIMHTLLTRLENTQWMSGMAFLESDFDILFLSESHEISSFSGMILEKFFGQIRSPKSPNFP